jgi:hypothetical protein
LETNRLATLGAKWVPPVSPSVVLFVHGAGSRHKTGEIGALVGLPFLEVESSRFDGGTQFRPRRRKIKKAVLLPKPGFPGWAAGRR